MLNLDASSVILMEDAKVTSRSEMDAVRALHTHQMVDIEVLQMNSSLLYYWDGDEFEPYGHHNSRPPDNDPLQKKHEYLLVNHQQKPGLVRAFLGTLNLIRHCRA